VSAFSDAVARITAAWALALAPASGREVIENPECGREEIILVPNGPILVHPLLMLERAHRDPHARLDAVVGYHADTAARRFDNAIARLERQSEADRWQIWLHELAGQVGMQMATEIAMDRARDERRQRALADRFIGDYVPVWHFPLRGTRESFVIIDEDR
jgi:hypothetical protein